MGPHTSHDVDTHNLTLDISILNAMLQRLLCSRGLAGHSHYHNIRHRKARVDKLRQAKLQRISQEIRSAIKSYHGHNDPNANPRLARAMETARKASMPKSRIQSAVQHAAQSSASSHAPLAVYEAVFPAGVAVIVRADRSRPNAVAADLRSLFNRAGGEFGKAMWMFQDRMSVVIAPQHLHSVHSIADAGIEQGADDVEENEDGAVELFSASLKERDILRNKIVDLFPGLDESNVYTVRVLQPRSTIDVEAELIEKFDKLLSALDEHPDIVEVVHNIDTTDE